MKILISLILITFILPYDAAANLPTSLSGLDKADFDKLSASQAVVKTKQIEGLSWPELTIYLKFDASPLEAVAIFYGLDHQKDYIPNLVKSEVVKEETPTRVYVDYELKLPWPLANSKYLHGHELSFNKEASEYLVKWWMEKSTSAEKVEGSALFVPYKDATILVYNSVVVPKSIFASFVESTMIKDVQKSLIAARDETIRAKKEDKNLLNKYVSFINNALSGKFSYLIKK